MNHDAYWIPGPWRGKLAILARPRGGDWLDDEMRGWRRAGINIIVSLLETDEAAQLDLRKEPAVARENGIQFIAFPIPDRGVPASLPDSIALMARLSRERDAGKNIAVHCRQGIGGSGLIAAGILANSGTHPDEALRIVGGARGLTVPETWEQREWVAQLPSKLSIVGR